MGDTDRSYDLSIMPRRRAKQPPRPCSSVLCVLASISIYVAGVFYSIQYVEHLTQQKESCIQSNRDIINERNESELLIIFKDFLIPERKKEFPKKKE
jgi:hypothetical protein